MVENRGKIIQRTAWIGIGANVLLAAAKFAAGLISRSSAILAEAANNLTDSFSSIITLVVSWLAGKPADKEHPFGHGRLEYLSSLVIGCLILYTGISCMISAVESIFHPTAPDLGFWPVAVVVMGFAVKIALGLYTRRQGKIAGSESLIATGKDALTDSLLSLVTLLSCVTWILWKVNIDGYAAAIIALFILKGGYDTVRQTISAILGERIPPELAAQIREFVLKDPQVVNTADLFLDSYGPEETVGSLHIEIPETMSASQIDELTRKLTKQIYKQFHIVMTIGIYAVPADAYGQQLYKKASEALMKLPNVISVHGFHLDEQKKAIYLDVVRSFHELNLPAFKKEIEQKLAQLIPGYAFHITIDSDMSD